MPFPLQILVKSILHLAILRQTEKPKKQKRQNPKQGLPTKNKTQRTGTPKKQPPGNQTPV